MVDDVPINQISEGTDEELVSFVLKDKNNYKYLIERYEAKLRRYIFRISGFAQEDIEDILQDTFINAYRKLNDFDTSLKFSSWIYRIAHNETISHLRKIKTRPSVIDIPETNEAVLNSLEADFNLEKNIEDKDIMDKAVTAIYSLPEQYRAVLVLKYLEDKSYQEISDIIKKPLGTVSILLKRGKDKLKTEISKSNLSI